MDDLISRKAAIDALWKVLYKYEDKTENQFIESEELDVADWIQHRIFVQNMSDIDRQTILDLPSAQPKLEKNTHSERVEIDKLGAKSGKTCTDTINRQAAISWIKAECNPYGKPTLDYETSCRIMEYLDRMPSAEPERKKGKWIEFPNHMAYKCSECGRIIQTTDGRRNVSKHYPFCHCGADMRVCHKKAL